MEGFDLDDSLNWPELYDLLNQENLLEDLRAAGREDHRAQPRAGQVSLQQVGENAREVLLRPDLVPPGLEPLEPGLAPPEFAAVEPERGVGVEAVEGALGEVVGRLYVERHFRPEAKARMGAAIALGDIGDPRALEPLQAVLTESDLDADLRAAAEKAIGRIRFRPPPGG